MKTFLKNIAIATTVCSTLALGMTTAIAQPADSMGFQIRQLKRMIVTQCDSAEATSPSIIIVSPVVDSDGNVSTPDVEYTDVPLPVDTTCITVDSYINADDVQGELLVWNNQVSGAIESMIYRANVRSGSRAYSLADWVLTESFSQNGANYMFESMLIQDEFGMPIQYPITFIRRSPDEQLVTVDGIESVVPNYDVTTMFKIEKEIDGGVLLFFLDFRN